MSRTMTNRLGLALIGAALACTSACTATGSATAAAVPGTQQQQQQPSGGGGGVNAGPVQQKYTFDSNTSSKGEFATIRMELGTRVFRATHTGAGNFILYATNTAPNSAPIVVFNEQGAGSWTFSTQNFDAGDYVLDLKAADGAWTLTVE